MRHVSGVRHVSGACYVSGAVANYASEENLGAPVSVSPESVHTQRQVLGGEPTSVTSDWMVVAQSRPIKHPQCNQNALTKK